MIRILAAAALCASLLGCAHRPNMAQPQMALWRLDCGRFEIKNLEGRGPVDMPVSCYVVRHGEQYLMFDAGL